MSDLNDVKTKDEYVLLEAIKNKRLSHILTILNVRIIESLGFDSAAADIIF